MIGKTILAYHVIPRMALRQTLFLAIVCLFLLSAESWATCYTVYDKFEKEIYKSQEPPFDLSGSISEGIKSKYPGGRLDIGVSATCYLPKKGDVTGESVNAVIRERNSDPRSRNVSEVKNHYTQSDDQIANGERIRRETENSTRQDAMEEARELAKSSGKCKFEYFVYGDDKGKQLALAAKEECLNNEALKKTGQSSQSLEAYDAWKDHHQMAGNRRNANAQRIQNAEAQRQLNEKIDDIRHTQKYGY